MSCGEHPAECVVTHLAPVLDGRRIGPRQWSAACPACRDGDRKLSISLGRQARIVMTCHRGHSFEEIRAALPAAVRGCLGRGQPGRHRKPGESAETKRLIDFIVTRKLPRTALQVGLLREMGVSPAEARSRLGLKKSTYYDALRSLAESGFSDSAAGQHQSGFSDSLPDH